MWRLTAGLAEALQAIHDRAVVHRDLKPSNVLLADDGPRVIDFGLAGALHDAAPDAGRLVIGSPPFMSPEQARRGPADLPAASIRYRSRTTRDVKARGQLTDR